MGLLERLAGRRLLVVTGKGGVGKTTVTAALGRALDRGHGRRTLLLELDPRESLYALTGVEPSGGGFGQVGERSFIQSVRPREVLDRFVARRVPAGPLARRVLASPVYAQIVEGAPGLAELAVLAHARDVLEGRVADAPTVETVLIDAPATGHALALLAAPRLVEEAVGEGPLGRVAAELWRLVADPDSAGVVLVTQPRRMPADETAELAGGVEQRLARPADLLVVNGLWPRLPAGGVGQPAGPGDWRASWLARRAEDEAGLARLAAIRCGPRVELPRVPAEGPALVAALAAALCDEERAR